MVATNIEQLEGMISSSINKEYPNTPPTEAQFEAMAVQIRNLINPLYPVSDTEFADIKRRLMAKVVVMMDLGIVIKDNKRPHQSWLPARRADLDFFFWKRYMLYC